MSYAPHRVIRLWEWETITYLWRAGNDGCSVEDLVQNCRIGWTNKLFDTDERLSRVRLNQEGITFYRQHWQEYHDLYPTVDAPEPNS